MTQLDSRLWGWAWSVLWLPWASCCTLERARWRLLTERVVIVLFHFIYFICPWAAAAAVIHSKNRVLHPRLTTVEQEYRCWSCTPPLEDASGSYRILWGPNLVGRILPPDQVKDPAVDSETDFKKGIWSPCLYHLENNCDRYVGDEVWFCDLFFSLCIIYYQWCWSPNVLLMNDFWKAAELTHC